MGNLCLINYDNKGNISNLCHDNTAKSYNIERVSARPVMLNVNDGLSDMSKKIKLANILKLENIFASCYDGTLPAKKCEKPIKLLFFNMDSCPSCRQFKPEYETWLHSLRQKRIPIESTDINIKKDHAERFFHEVGCNATPCVVMQNPTNPNKYIKLSEGVPSQIQLLANMLGVKNPNLFPLDPIKVNPINLM